MALVSSMIEHPIGVVVLRRIWMSWYLLISGFIHSPCSFSKFLKSWFLTSAPTPRMPTWLQTVLQIWYTFELWESNSIRVSPIQRIISILNFACCLLISTQWPQLHGFQCAPYPWPMTSGLVAVRSTEARKLGSNLTSAACNFSKRQRAKYRVYKTMLIISSVGQTVTVE